MKRLKEVLSTLSCTEMQHVADLSEQLESVPVRDFEDIGLFVGVQPSREWEIRVGAGNRRGVGVVHELSGQSIWRWPSTLWAQFWISETELDRRGYSRIGMPIGDTTTRRLYRAIRGVLDIPAAVWFLRKARRSH